jgi:PEP-CTERM motif
MHRSLAIVLFPLLFTSAVRSAAITGNDSGTNNPATHDPYIVSLDPAPVLHLNGITAAELLLLQHSFGNWTFAASGQQAPGTFDVLQYEPFALATLGGADFSVLYSDGKNDKPTNLDWIQIAYAHNWGAAGNETTVDSLVGGSPFYSDYTPANLPNESTPVPGNPRYRGPDIWKNATDYPRQHIQNPAGGGKLPAGGNLLFVDEPKCPYSCVPNNDFSSLVLDLYLVSFTANATGGGTIQIFDGLEWGVEITCKEAGACASTPEPGTAADTLLGLGLVGIGIVRRLSMRVRNRSYPV